jgi:type IV secretion system protein VirB9
MKCLVIAAALAALSASSAAESIPQFSMSDQRIRQVTYNPAEVYEVTGSYRLTTTIEFEKGETVQYLTLGDTIAWQAHPMGHRVHLKPVEPRAVTNLTVITDRRAYYFRLTAAAPKDKVDATYLLRFSYVSSPEIAVNPAALQKPAAEAKADVPEERKVRSCNYSVSGSKSIKLVRACDDGLFTYLEFAPDVSLPAFFAVEADGAESVVNYRMEGKIVVIERLASLYTLRDGNESLCLFNDDKPVQAEDSAPRHTLKQRVRS